MMSIKGHISQKKNEFNYDLYFSIVLYLRSRKNRTEQNEGL